MRFDKLPAFVRQTLSELQEASDDSAALVNSTMRAIDRLERQIGNTRQRADSAGSVNALDAAQAEISRVESELKTAREKLTARQARAAADARVAVRMGDWLERLDAGAVLKTVEVRPRLKPAETLSGAIDRIRSDIAGMQDAMKALKRTPRTAGELKKDASAFVATLAEKGRPTIPMRGAFSAIWHDHSQTPISVGSYASVLALTAWLDPAKFEAALFREIDAMNLTEAVTEAEQLACAIKLEDEILGAERAEETLIRAAHAAGIDVARRTKADPLAILGIVFGEEEAERAAA